MSTAEITAAIPHRPPFLFLDEVVSSADDRIHCRRTFTGEEAFYQGHYPRQPITPGVILCEAAMQAGAVLLSRRVSGEGVPVATRMNDVRFKRIVEPGETVDIEVTLDDELGGAFYLTGRVSVGGKLAARLSFACTLTEAP
ncbi:MAG: 3-hydroxyacyl-ACP dehydratase FabZ family protein [Pirellulales bacterium]|nr:beta-hydroxyacyl-ACP dehydratase [Planctomycetales bacterium]